MADQDVPETSNPTTARTIREWISLVARLILGGALLIAGLLSIGDLAQSVEAVKAYELPLPEYIHVMIGYALPVVEILLGAVIIAGLLTRWVALLGGLMMVAFIAGITFVWVKGSAIDCGCFSIGGFLPPGENPTYLQDIIRDIGFLVCAVWLIIFPRSRFSLDSWINTEASIDEASETS